jgi:hypothetical protein
MGCYAVEVWRFFVSRLRVGPFASRATWLWAGTWKIAMQKVAAHRKLLEAIWKRLFLAEVVAGAAPLPATHALARIMPLW